jgi:hypothetical protein
MHTTWAAVETVVISAVVVMVLGRCAVAVAVRVGVLVLVLDRGGRSGAGLRRGKLVAGLLITCAWRTSAPGNERQPAHVTTLLLLLLQMVVMMMMMMIHCVSHMLLCLLTTSPLQTRGLCWNM